MVSTTPRPFYPRERCGTNCKFFTVVSCIFTCQQHETYIGIHVKCVTFGLILGESGSSWHIFIKIYNTKFDENPSSESPFWYLLTEGRMDCSPLWESTLKEKVAIKTCNNNLYDVCISIMSLNYNYQTFYSGTF